MKQWKQRLSAFFSRPWGIPAACYLLALAVWVLVGLGSLAGDSLARAQGRLTQQVVELDRFILSELELSRDGADLKSEDGSVSGLLMTTGGDPQMILEDVSGQVVRTLSYQAEFDGSPREMCLYYTTAVGEPYSQDRRVFPEVTADGTYVYTLPRKNIVSLRLDPCSPDENKQVGITFLPAAIELNAPSPLPGGLEELIPSWYELFCLVLYPGLAAAALDWAIAVGKKLRKK